MKLFRKKNTQPTQISPRTARSTPADNFYSQHAGEAPLDGHSADSGGRQIHRMSRHSPARLREETSNRVSNKAIAILLFRTVLIVVLLVAGLIALKWGLSFLDKPSEKKQQQWAANAMRMEKSSAMGELPAGAAVPSAQVVSAALIEQRLERWEQTERHLRSAEALSRRGINDEAAERLGQALRITPDNREAQQMLVDIYMQQGLYAEAVPLCIRLLDQDSRQPILQMNLLRALEASKQSEAGLVLAERLLLDQPNNLIVLSIVATGQLKQGKQEAGLALFERILKNDPKNTEALENCGKVYFAQKDPQKAVPYYLELVRFDPKPSHYQMLARCYAQLNQAGKAVVFLGQAASLFGETTIAPWLRDVGFDSVRETVEFRSFADRVVGVETRKAIEDINRREAEKATSVAPGGGLELPKRPELNAIQPQK
jgi:tetratricopeptide (TPR) repeat protein